MPEDIDPWSRKTPEQPKNPSTAGCVLGVLSLMCLVLWILILVGLQFRYSDADDTKDGSALQQMEWLEKACKAYMSKNNGTLPPTLQELVTPPDGGRPWIEGGQSALLDPWNTPYQYNPSNKKPNGEPDPVVF